MNYSLLTNAIFLLKSSDFNNFINIFIKEDIKKIIGHFYVQ